MNETEPGEHNILELEDGTVWCSKCQRGPSHPQWLKDCPGEMQE